MAQKGGDLRIRWLVLVLACSLMIGNYWVYDNPAALEKPIETYMNLNTAQFNLLYTVYSIPNTVLPLIGGYLFVAKLGERFSIVVFCLCIALGQALFALGSNVESFALMLVGRTVFGLGGESLSVAQSALMVKWFKGKELAFSLGLNLSIARLGSVMNNLVEPIFVPEGEYDDLPNALWFGWIICVFSLDCAIIVFYIDKKYEKQLDMSGFDEEAEAIRLSDIKHFGLPFWIVTMSCQATYGCILPFNNDANQFLQKKWHLTLGSMDESQTAGVVMSTTYIVSACLSPFLGGAIDKFGYGAILFSISSFALIFVHLLLGVTYIFPVIPLAFLGLSYSVYASALWPAIAHTVERAHVGTAYGIVTAWQNVGLAVVPLISGYLISNEGYTETELFYSGLALLGFILGTWLNINDSKNGFPGPLNRVHTAQPELTESLVEKQ